MSLHSCEASVSQPTDRPAVLVTGAAGGIGTAITETLARRGLHVYAAVRGGGEHLKGLPNVDIVGLDVTDRGSVRAAAEQVTAARRDRGLRAVVNNAGVIVHGPVELVAAAELERQFAVNVFGAVEVAQAFLPLLRAGRGRLVNISAPSASVAIPFAGPISASKAALDSFSDAARVELAPWGIHVVTVVPGAIETPIFTKADAAAQAALRDADPGKVALYSRQLEAVAGAQAAMRTSKPQTVADTVLRAIEASKPKAYYLANADARAAAMLSRLPTRTKDRLLTRMLGLRKTAPVAS
ncbi:hypothetical protein BCD48_02500 [Pseudofrankia sp. BMG5.36]|nr:hypothetical protein BCD48_02500 [Pseudofrankia sp. BMG5.36]